jgi:enamine deaminase RidA (YjgF/YER057c/UK114 family)
VTGDLRFHSSAGVGTGGSYSHAVVDGDYAFLAGQLAVDAPGGAPSDIRAETRVVMGLLARVLADLGLGLGDLVRTNVYLRELADFAGMDAEYAAAFGDGPLPARTCVQVGALIGGCRVEIDGIARRPRRQG